MDISPPPSKHLFHPILIPITSYKYFTWSHKSLKRIYYIKKVFIAQASGVQKEILLVSLTMAIVVRPYIKNKNSVDISFNMRRNENFFTVCPRSLDQFYIVFYCIKWAKTLHIQYFFIVPFFDYRTKHSRY